MGELILVVIILAIKLAVVCGFVWLIAWCCGFDPLTATAFEKTVLGLFLAVVLLMPESK